MYSSGSVENGKFYMFCLLGRVFSFRNVSCVLLRNLLERVSSLGLAFAREGDSMFLYLLLLPTNPSCFLYLFHREDALEWNVSFICLFLKRSFALVGDFAWRYFPSPFCANNLPVSLLVL